VTTERQLAANRRNARSSTGPRSKGGKERASRNSYRYGLSGPLKTTEEHATLVENLARQIAPDTTDFVVLQYARAAAEAEFGIARVRQTKVALIERMMAFGQFEQPQLFKSVRQITAFFNALDRGELKVPNPIDTAKTIPLGEADRPADAVRRVLPELRRLDRYERRAAALRDRCLRAIKNRAII
jgi:hypothetical protein